jgi:hypothetical protein
MGDMDLSDCAKDLFVEATQASKQPRPASATGFNPLTENATFLDNRPAALLVTKRQAQTARRAFAAGSASARAFSPLVDPERGSIATDTLVIQNSRRLVIFFL